MTFARHQFELSQPQDDGQPTIAHIEAWERSTGKTHELLANAPALPGGCEALWAKFLELHGSRGSTGWGAARITFADLDAWQRIRRTQLSAWEIDRIRAADDMWLADFAPKPKDGK